MNDTKMDVRLDNSATSRLIADSICRYAIPVDSEKYDIVAINNKTGKRFPIGFDPMTLREAQIVLSKFTYHPLRRLIIERV